MKTALRASASLLFLIAASNIFPQGAKGQPLTKSDIQLLRESYFVWGGVDTRSYVYWPVTPPDLKPLLLVKAGKREEAFSYCFSKMKATDGDLKFFYTIQAASMGFGIWKTHLVVSELLPEYRRVKQNAKRQHLELVGNDRFLELSLAYAVTLAGASGMGMERDPKVQAWKKLRNSNEDTIRTAIDDSLNRRYTKVEHIAVAAVITSLESYRKPTAYELWSTVLRTDPKSPQLNLAMSIIASSRKIGQALVDGKIVEIPDENTSARPDYAERALALDPNNVRALYRVASNVSYTDRTRAIALFTKCLALGTGPAIEIESAKARLAELKSAKP